MRGTAGSMAPNSCNHQNWHFVIVHDSAIRNRCADIASGNRHFRDCGGLIYLCFQMGWVHDKFSVVQSVAAAASNIILGAQLRGLASIWNAGIGDIAALRALLGVPASFEIVGAICIGHPSAAFALLSKPPRRPVEHVCSFDGFSRPARSIYPTRRTDGFRFEDVANSANPYAVWNPEEWGWERLADFRGYSVWNKSPAPQVFEDAVFAELVSRVLALTTAEREGKDVIDFLSWGGGSTVRIAAAHGGERKTIVVEASRHNLRFIEDRIRSARLDLGRFQFVDLSALDFRIDALPEADFILAVHALEFCPRPRDVCRSLVGRLRRRGKLALLIQNATSPASYLGYRRQKRRQVSNRGPHRPLSILKVYAWLRDSVRIDRIIGYRARRDGSVAEFEGTTPLHVALADHVLVIAGPGEKRHAPAGETPLGRIGDR